jgi:hypothetical protein
VFRTEQHREPRAVRCAEQIGVAPAEMIDPRVIREETEALAGNQVCRIGEQDLDTRADLGGDG